MLPTLIHMLYGEKIYHSYQDIQKSLCKSKANNKYKRYVESKDEPEKLRTGEINGFKTIWEMYAEGVKKFGEMD